MATPITQKQWQALQPGDKIRDCLDRDWKITRRHTTDPDVLYAECPLHEPEGLRWHDDMICEEDDPTAHLHELNRPGAGIVKIVEDE